MGPLVGIPFALTSFVLTVLALVAGMRAGLEDYHIIMLNTSDFGRSLVPTSAGGDQPTPVSCELGGFLDDICESAATKAGDAVGSGIEELSGLEKDITGKLAEELGIQQWYSLHVTNVCKGTFTPNATTPGAGYDVSACTKPLQTFNVSALLDHELGVGQFHVNLADLGLTQDLSDQLNRIPELFHTLTVLYILGVAFSGLSLTFSIAGILLQFSHPLVVSLTNACTALQGALVLLAGNVMIAASAKIGVDTVNKLGQNIGLMASTGRKFVIITWAAFALMAVVTVAWLYELCRSIRAKRFVLRRRHMACI